MTDALARIATAALLLALGVAVLLPAPGWLALAATGGTSASRMQQVLDALPSGGRALVAFDPDLGTYAEIRPTVRVLLDDLDQRGLRIAVVSLTPEGRALAIAELARIDAAPGGDGALADLGFVSGAEAAIVDLAEDPPSADALVVVGGNDLGPRSWVEQYLPRVPDLPAIAIAPAVLLPETRPYLASGQLDAALLTPSDGAAFREAIGADGAGPPSVALFVGLVIAIVVIGQALLSRLASVLRAGRPREAT